MNRFLIFANSDKDENYALSHKLKEYIVSRGAYADITGDGCFCDLQDIDIVIVLGGDGTMLRAVNMIGEYDIPLIGINLGTMGFLTEIEENYAYDAVDRLLNDDFRIEKRMMIEGKVGDKCFHSLNDLVITRAGFSRIIGLNVYVNDQLLDTYEADGVIVATPTGSTGYNLSAGGPIVSPGSKVIVVTPISPHSLTTKSVVFGSHDKIKIEIIKKRKTQDTEAIVSFDGENGIGLSAGDVVYARMSDREVSLIRMYDTNFYTILREKIGG